MTESILTKLYKSQEIFVQEPGNIYKGATLSAFFSQQVP